MSGGALRVETKDHFGMKGGRQALILTGHFGEETLRLLRTELPGLDIAFGTPLFQDLGVVLESPDGSNVIVDEEGVIEADEVISWE